MFTFIYRRIVHAIPVILIIATVTFFLIRLAPGDPLSDEKAVPPEIRVNLEAHYGFDDPLWLQYFHYMGNLFQGDLGPSFKYIGWTVNELIAQSFLVSLELGLLALIIAVLLGTISGTIAAVNKNSSLDYFPMTIAMAGICMPTFVMGPLLVLFFGLYLEWFNPLGWEQWSDRVLPALTLGIYYAAYIARLTRSGMLEILNSDYIRTARAKGLPEWRVVLVHGIKTGLLPVVAFLGPASAGLISGSFVVETIFQVPGLGRFFVMAAFNRDYTMVLGTVLFYATLIILLNLIVDIIQVILNPRLKYE
jgi:oligopeptide transport system permease protein